MGDSGKYLTTSRIEIDKRKFDYIPDQRYIDHIFNSVFCDEVHKIVESITQTDITLDYTLKYRPSKKEIIFYKNSIEYTKCVVDENPYLDNIEYDFKIDQVREYLKKYAVIYDNFTVSVSRIKNSLFDNSRVCYIGTDDYKIHVTDIVNVGTKNSGVIFKIDRLISKKTYEKEFKYNKLWTGFKNHYNFDLKTMHLYVEEESVYLRVLTKLGESINMCKIFEL